MLFSAHKKTAIALLSSATAFLLYNAVEVNSVRAFENSSPKGGAPHLEKQYITAYPNFEKACVAFVTGYTRSTTGSKLAPSVGRFRGSCSDELKPLILSVTQENEKNNHKGSANYDSNISSYMGDFDYDEDMGKWLDLRVFEETPRRILLSLDTANFRKTNVTGWPLQYGHMFVGITDQTVTASLDTDVFVEFEIKIHDDDISNGVGASYYNGRRVLVGTSGKWSEAAPRTNFTHYLEINLNQTPQFSASYNEPIYPLCQDVVYDRCFYGDGRFPEGREISYQSVLQGPAIRNEWTRIKINLSQTFKRLQWVSPPSDWKAAKLGGLYIAVESTGATNTRIELRNYVVYALR